MNSRKRDNKYIKDEIIKNVLVDNTKIKRDLNFKFTSNKKIKILKQMPDCHQDGALIIENN